MKRDTVTDRYCLALVVVLIVGSVAVPGVGAATQPTPDSLNVIQSDEASAFSVDYTVSTTVTATGSPVTITATVTNTGNSSGTTTVPLYVNGSEVADKTVTLDAGASTEITYSKAFATAGNHTVQVGNTDPTAVTVGGRFFDDSSVETFELSPGLDAWTRFLFPLRTNPDAATTRLDNRQRFIFQGSNGISLGKDQTGVYRVGDTVPITFDPSRAADKPGDPFASVPVQVVAVRLRGSQNLSARTIGDIASGGEAASTEIAESRIINSSGKSEFTYTPSESGQYILFFASPTERDSQFTTSDAGFAVDGNLTLLGFETVAVEQSASDVTIENAQGTVFSGNDAAFNVSMPGASGQDVHHLVMLYDNATFSGATEITEIEGGLSVGAIADQTQMSTTIGLSNGERRIHNRFTVLGVDYTNDVITRTQGIGSTVDFIAESAGRRPPVNMTLDETVLDASVTTRTANATETIRVGTNRNFSAGTYRWVHIARVEDEANFATAAGTVEIADGTQLSVTANRTDIVAGETVRLNVTQADTGESINTSVDIGDRTVTTGTDGVVTVTVQQTGTVPVTARTPSRSFYAGVTELQVEPLSLNVSVSPTEPVAGDAFTVSVDRIDTDEPVNTTVVVGDRTLRTGADGQVTTQANESGDLSIRATPPSARFQGDATTIRVLQPATTNVVSYGVEDTRITQGDSTTVTATIKNVGDIEGNQSVSLTVGGAEIEQTKTVTIGPGTTKDVEFIVELPEPGTYNVTVGDAAPTVITVSVTLPYEDSFTTGLEGWTVDGDDGTAAVNETEPGRINVTATGDPGPRLHRVLGPLTAGTRIEVAYTPDRLVDAGGTIASRIRLPSGETIALDADTGTAADGTLRGVVPRDVQADATVVVAVDADGTTTGAAIDSISLRAPPELALTARQDGDPVRRQVTAGEPFTFALERVDTGAPLNRTLEIEGPDYSTEIVTSNGTTAPWSPPVTGTYEITVVRPTVNESVFGTDRVVLDVNRQSVPLSLTANRTTLTDQEAATFTVNRTDTSEPVAATVTIGGEALRTGADGQLTYQFTQPARQRTVTAAKSQTNLTAFESDRIDVTVEPAVNVSNFTLQAHNGTTLAVGFEADETLATTRVDLARRDGTVARTLTNFTAWSDNGTTRYRTTADVDSAGLYTAVLRRAETADNESGALGQRAAVPLLAPGSTNLSVPASTTTPEIDGALDDSAWLDAAAYNLSLLNEGGKATDGRLLVSHDGEYLYLGLDTELNSGTYTFGTLRFDGDDDGSLSGNDSRPQTDIGITQSGPISGAGVVDDYRLLGTDRSIDQPQGVESASTSSPMTYEYRVPLSVLDLNQGDTTGIEILTHDAAITTPAYYWAFQPGADGPEATGWPGLTIEPSNVSVAYDYEPDQPTVGEPVTFNGSASSAVVGSVTDYQWQIGPTGSVRATGQQATYAFTEPGVYPVTLRVRTDANQSATLTREITVAPAPAATRPLSEQFDSNATGWVIGPARTKQVNATSTGYWTTQYNGSVALQANASDEAVTLRRPIDGIQVGDAVSASIALPETTNGSGTVSLSIVESGAVTTLDSARYNATTTGQIELSSYAPSVLSDGTNVTVTHQSSNGTTTVGVTSVTVEEGVSPPRANLTVSDRTVTPGDAVTLDASGSTDPDGDIRNANITWSSPDDAIINSSGLTATVTGETVGGVTVTAEITDEDGNTSVASEHITVVPTGTQLVFADDFENDAIGSYPDGWTSNGNDAQRITSGTAASGNRSFRLQGRAGGCWEAISNRQLPTTAPSNGSLFVQAQVLVDSPEGGCHNSNADLKLRTSDYGWWSGDRAPLSAFATDGTVRAAGEQVGSDYRRGQWITLQLSYQRANDAVRVSLMKDGKRLGTTTRRATSYEDALSYLSISSGDTTVYYDDIVVAANTTSPLPAANDAPTASLSANTTDPASGEPVLLNASGSTDADGNVSSYAWDFDSDGTVEATGPTVVHTFETTGTRTVELTVTDDRFASNATTQQFSVARSRSLVAFSDTEPVSTELDTVANATRVNSTVAETSVVTRSQTSTNTTFRIDTNATDTTTVYVRKAAVPAGEPLLLVDGEISRYYTDETAGTSSETWLAFTLTQSAATVTFTTNTAPTLDTRLRPDVSGVNYAGNPVRLTVDAADIDGQLRTVTYRLPGGTNVTLPESGQSSVSRRVNITLPEPTWNRTQGSYEPQNITFVSVDNDGQTTTDAVPVIVRAQGDTTGDGVVDIYDIVLLGRYLGTQQGSDAYRNTADINNDGVVDITDAARLGQSWETNVTSISD